MRIVTLITKQLSKAWNFWGLERVSGTLVFISITLAFVVLIFGFVAMMDGQDTMVGWDSPLER